MSISEKDKRNTAQPSLASTASFVRKLNPLLRNVFHGKQAVKPTAVRIQLPGARTLSKLSVRASLWIAFAVMLGGALLIGVFSLIQMGGLNRSSQTLYEQAYIAGQATEQVRSTVLKVSRAQTQLLTATTAQERDALGRQIEEALALIVERLKPVEAASADNETKARVTELAQGIQPWAKTVREYVVLIKSQSLDLMQMSPDVITYDARLNSATRKIEASVDSLVDSRARAVEQTVLASGAIYRSSLAWVAAITAVLLLLAGGIGTWVTRRVTRQLGGEPAMAKQIAGRIAGGDLAFAVPVAAGDQSSLVHSLSEMQRQLAGTLQEIAQSSHQVATASEHITTGNEELSDRTDQQSEALERTVGNIKQLADIAQNNAHSAGEAAALTSHAAKATQTSREVMHKVATTMQQISDNTKSIQSISDVIESIAFRTNILALNAAVEAAHAGEQGRGFAVVASEVRALAERCATAAREIKALIRGSTSQVDSGVALTKQANQSIHDVRDTIQSVATVMNEISDASRQQSEGIKAINQAVSELDQGNQKNVELVKLSVQTAQSLDHQARTLDDLLSRFKLSAA